MLVYPAVGREEPLFISGVACNDIGPPLRVFVYREAGAPVLLLSIWKLPIEPLPPIRLLYRTFTRLRLFGATPFQFQLVGAVVTSPIAEGSASAGRDCEANFFSKSGDMPLRAKIASASSCTTSTGR